MDIEKFNDKEIRQQNLDSEERRLNKELLKKACYLQLGSGFQDGLIVLVELFCGFLV